MEKRRRKRFTASWRVAQEEAEKNGVRKPFYIDFTVVKSNIEVMRWEKVVSAEIG